MIKNSNVYEEEKVKNEVKVAKKREERESKLRIEANENQPGKYKLMKVHEYKKHVKELHLPKISVRKKDELEALKAKLKHKPLERRPL